MQQHNCNATALPPACPSLLSVIYITLNNAASGLLDDNEYYARAVPLGGAGGSFLYRRACVRARVMQIREERKGMGFGGSVLLW